MKLHDTEFHFKGFGNCDSRCRLRIYQQLHMDDKVVILTQLEGDVGTSVTNASEIIANAVAEQFKLEPLRTIWIEHYQDRGNAINYQKESFDRVTYSLAVGGKFEHARWNHLTREIVADLIGEEP